MGSVVLEDDVESIADLSVEDRSQQPLILIFRAARLQRGEGRIGVLAIDGLLVDSADLMRARFGEPLAIRSNSIPIASSRPAGA
jgi:hypothetical protein